MIVFTSICANYIPKAKVLANSLKLHNPDVKFVVCLVERTIHQSTYGENIDFVIPVTKLKIPNFESFIFKYNQAEAATAVKGYFFQELLKKFFKEDKFVFLDPDLLVMASFTELEKAMSNHNIVLIPHAIEPESSMNSIIDNEISFLKHGVFNLGFLGIRRSEESIRFLKWWSKRLHEFCHIDYCRGLYTDQKWMDLVPCFFNPYIFKNPGYDVAPWNLSHRKITKGRSGIYSVGNSNLIFFHFSGWDSGICKDMIFKYSRGSSDPAFELVKSYQKLIDEQGQRELGDLPWGFGFYSNGAVIKQSHRLVYGSNKMMHKEYKNPFDASGKYSYFKYIQIIDRPIPSFWLNRNQLIKKVIKAYRQGGAKFVRQKAINYLKYYIGLSKHSKRAN